MTIFINLILLCFYNIINFIRILNFVYINTQLDIIKERFSVLFFFRYKSANSFIKLSVMQKKKEFGKREFSSLIFKNKMVRSPEKSI